MPNDKEHVAHSHAIVLERESQREDSEEEVACMCFPPSLLSRRPFVTLCSLRVRMTKFLKHKLISQFLFQKLKS